MTKRKHWRKSRPLELPIHYGVKTETRISFRFDDFTGWKQEQIHAFMTGVSKVVGVSQSLRGSHDK